MLHKTAIMKTTAIKHATHKMEITPSEQQKILLAKHKNQKTKKEVRFMLKIFSS